MKLKTIGLLCSIVSIHTVYSATPPKYSRAELIAFRDTPPSSPLSGSDFLDIPEDIRDENATELNAIQEAKTKLFELYNQYPHLMQKIANSSLTEKQNAFLTKREATVLEKINKKYNYEIPNNFVDGWRFSWKKKINLHSKHSPQTNI